MFDYIKALKQLNDVENTYGKEIGKLNNTINDERIRTNELRNEIQHLEDAEEESLEITDELDNANNEYSNLLLEYNQLNEEFIKIKDHLYKTKSELNRSENDINKIKKIKKSIIIKILK